jgi:hypothetical protein
MASASVIVRKPAGKLSLASRVRGLPADGRKRVRISAGFTGIGLVIFATSLKLSYFAHPRYDRIVDIRQLSR